LEPDHQERYCISRTLRPKKKQLLPVVFIGKLGAFMEGVEQVARPKWYPFADDLCAPVSGKGSYVDIQRQIRE
jgi:hypothetical protein